MWQWKRRLGKGHATIFGGCELSLKFAQVVVERLNVGEYTHWIRFPTHDHHVIHFDEPVAASLQSGDKGREIQSMNWTSRHTPA